MVKEGAIEANDKINLDSSIKKQRYSNIELLRVIAMLGIILCHIGGVFNDQLANDATGVFFNVPTFIKKLLIVETFMPLGALGNAIFMLISGYFICNVSKEIDLIKISKKLLCQTGFITICVIIASFILSFINKDNYVYLSDTNTFNTEFWYIGYYYTIVVIAKLYLNDKLEKLSNKQYLTFLIVCFCLAQFQWSGVLLESLASGVRVLLTGVFLFSLGGYLRKYNPFEKIKNSILFLSIIAIYIIDYISYYNKVVSNVSYFTKYGGAMPAHTLNVYTSYNPIILILAISLFEIFKRINIKENSLINFLGKSTFIVYLFHSNKFIYSLVGTIEWAKILFNNPVYYLVLFIGIGLAEFAFGVIVYIIYFYLGRFINKHLNFFLKS